MKKCFKSSVLSLCIVALFSSINLASATTTTAEIETVLNWAENSFPEFFPDHQPTQISDPWVYRFYPSTGIYTGVSDNQVFVFGGPWGTDSPTFVETLLNLFIHIQAIDGDGSVPACSPATEIPFGLVVTQNENDINFTTNGQCVTYPEWDKNKNYCKPPIQPEPSGINVFYEADVITSEGSAYVGGFTSNEVTRSLSSCVINAPAETIDRTINSDICFDITDYLKSTLGFSPGIRRPSTRDTISLVTTSKGQVVPDCSDTDAGSIIDAFTGESWVKSRAGYIKEDCVDSGRCVVESF